MWQLGVFFFGVGALLYCIVFSIATIMNAYTNIQAVDILQEMQKLQHGHDSEDEGDNRKPYQPD